MSALAEFSRVLKRGGMLIALENRLLQVMTLPWGRSILCIAKKC